MDIKNVQRVKLAVKPNYSITPGIHLMKINDTTIYSQQRYISKYNFK